MENGNHLKYGSKSCDKFKLKHMLIYRIKFSFW